jgi:hypothetical protein
MGAVTSADDLRRGARLLRTNLAVIHTRSSHLGMPEAA